MQPDAKIAAQFAAKAKRDTLTTQLRDAYGTHVSRKELKAFEKSAGVTVQWVARRGDLAQTFRTPLGFVRSAGARGVYVIPPVAVIAPMGGDPVEVYDSVPGGGGELDERPGAAEFKALFKELNDGVPLTSEARKQALGV